MTKSIIPIQLPVPYDLRTINMYLYQSGNSLSLIDACLDTEEAWDKLMNTLAEAGFELKDVDRIILTHHHGDHIGLAHRILKVNDIPVYLHPNGVPRVAADEHVQQMRYSFYEWLYNKAGCGEEGVNYLRSSFVERLEEEKNRKIVGNLVPVSAGSVIPGAEDLMVIEVPGHAQDHLCFLDRTEGWLMTGDHLVKHISSNAIVDCDEAGQKIKTLIQYRESLRRIRDLDVSVTSVYSGHGVSFQDHRALIDHRLQRMDVKGERILGFLRDGISTPYEVAQRLYPNEIKRQFSLVMSEVIGMLDYMESEKQVLKDEQQGIWHYRENVAS